MNEVASSPDDRAESDESSIRPPLSPKEAMELAIRASITAHLVVCVLTFVLVFAVPGANVWVGLVGVAVLLMLIPFLVVPVGAVIGIGSRLVFRDSTLSLPLLIYVLAIIFEVTLFGWIVVVFVARF